MENKFSSAGLSIEENVTLSVCKKYSFLLYDDVFLLRS